MRDVLIESWDALHSAVFENVWDPAIMRYRNNRVYRGMSDGQWALTPSLNRACPQDLSLEKILLRSFMKYGYTELQGCNSFCDPIRRRMPDRRGQQGCDRKRHSTFFRRSMASRTFARELNALMRM